MVRYGFVIVVAFVVTTGLHAVAQQSGVSTTPRLLPGTKTNLFPTIRGTATTSGNSPLPHAVVRLRDARFGRIVGTQTTDASGAFSFNTLDPGSYVVEVMGNDGVLAASPIINVNAGDVATAAVRLPLRLPMTARFVNHAGPSAGAVLSAAAASGVLARTVSGQPISAVVP